MPSQLSTYEDDFPVITAGEVPMPDVWETRSTAVHDENEERIRLRCRFFSYVVFLGDVLAFDQGLGALGICYRTDCCGGRMDSAN